jgi:hypothetical protein
MSRDVGILVVNRLDLMKLALRAGRLRRTFVGLSPEQVFRRYRGFDGLAWPVEDHPRFDLEGGLADPSERAAIDDYLRSLPSPEEADLVLVGRSARRLDEGGFPGWSFAGFDVGSYESEWSHFSVVLNEVIWGTNPELGAFARLLGDNLLLQNLYDARALVAVHDDLRIKGKDVEQGRMEPIAIYVPS